MRLRECPNFMEDRVKIHNSWTSIGKKETTHLEKEKLKSQHSYHCSCLYIVHPDLIGSHWSWVID